MIYLLVAEEQRFFDPERPFAALRANRSDRPFADSLSVKPMGLSTRYHYERSGKRAGSCRSGAFDSDPSQLDVIGYFAKISSTRLNAFSAAACGVARS